MKVERPDHPVPAAALLRASLRRATEQVIAIRRKLGEEGDELRSDVLADLKDAMADSASTVEMIEVPGEPGTHRCISVEEFFRGVLAAFGLDGSDLYLQEIVYELVRGFLDEMLAGDGAGRAD